MKQVLAGCTNQVLVRINVFVLALGSSRLTSLHLTLTSRYTRQNVMSW